MEQPERRVVICGRSVFTMAVEISLSQRPGMCVIRIDPHLPDVVERVIDLAPHVVLIERDGGQGEMALALLGRGIPLIEVDAERKQATSLCGRRLPARGAGDLVDVIEKTIAEAREGA